MRLFAKLPIDICVANGPAKQTRCTHFRPSVGRPRLIRHASINSSHNKALSGLLVGEVAAHSMQHSFYQWQPIDVLRYSMDDLPPRRYSINNVLSVSRLCETLGGTRAYRGWRAVRTR